TASRDNHAHGGAHGLAAPVVMPAASSGLVVPVVVAESARGGGQNVQVLEPMVGGTGARDGADGVDGRDSGISNLANNPVETVETEIGAEIVRYALRPDSGGPGRWRGGCGLELVFRVLGDDSRLLARGLERMRFRPGGPGGGGPGAPAELVVNEGLPGERRYTKIDMVALRRGDTVTLRTSGAGGHGDPWTRDPGAVLADLRRGLVTEEAAAASYGVAVTSGDDGRPVLDGTATEELRRTPPSPPLGPGPERAAWDAVHDTESADRLVAALFRLPPSRRYARRAAVHTAVLAALPDGFPVTAASAGELAEARTVLRRHTDALEEESTG
ncbi:hydantoinase B/oxoprolinase family protein, partial [Streptomyces sp. NPDC059096]|uniref:hydantoinase B/oxoprolinase family protein n=1 Tax=Streptomyces sp. NPDC059096 TaxID=3346727 RepID=UPI0036B066D9